MSSTLVKAPGFSLLSYVAAATATLLVGCAEPVDPTHEIVAPTRSALDTCPNDCEPPDFSVDLTVPPGGLTLPLGGSATLPVAVSCSGGGGVVTALWTS